jgi:flagellar hook protein FlgE
VDNNSTSSEVQITGAITDLQLTSYQSPPSATSYVSMYLNLDKNSEDESTDATNPFFAMFNQWDGTDEEPLGDSTYSFQNTITVYDEAGSPHELTVYFDPVQDDAVTSGAGGNQVWEYVVTCNPSDDGRTIDGQSLSTTSSAGLLMTGTMTFNASGQMLGMTAFTLKSTAAGDLKDLSNWTPADFSEDGYPVFTANFSGSDDADGTDQNAALNVEIDFGIRNKDTTGTGWNTAITDASALGTSYANLFTMNNQEIVSDSVSAYDGSSTALDQSQDGYAMGFLQSISTDRDGVITGTYSNGQVIDLFVLALADFTNEQGLVLDGGNLYLEGSESGDPTTGRANTARFGSISPNTLEQSNVDVSTEMVRLITTQRGYQANSKVITTADTLLQEAINLKR